MGPHKILDFLDHTNKIKVSFFSLTWVIIVAISCDVIVYTQEIGIVTEYACYKL